MLVAPLTFHLFLEHHLDLFGAGATISQTFRTHKSSGISVYFSGVFNGVQMHKEPSVLLKIFSKLFSFSVSVSEMERGLNRHSDAEYSFNMSQLILVECCVQLKYQHWGFNRAQSCWKFQFLARMSIFYVPSVCYLTKQRILSYCSRSKMYDSCLHILLQNRNKEISLLTHHASFTGLLPFTLP